MSPDSVVAEGTQARRAPSNPFGWYFEVLRKFVVFDGRARRAEYWMFTLINIVVAVVLALVDDSAVLYGVYVLAMFLPSLAVSVRRLHDTGRSGWWLLLYLVPILGALALLVFMCEDSRAGANEYGPNPKTA